MMRRTTSVMIVRRERVIICNHLRWGQLPSAGRAKGVGYPPFARKRRRAGQSVPGRFVEFNHHFIFPNVDVTLLRSNVWENPGEFTYSLGDTGHHFDAQ
jgi:hypothetical protein